MAGLAVRARPSVRPGRVRGARGAFGWARSGRWRVRSGAFGAGRGERARCQGAARSTAGIPPARGTLAEREAHDRPGGPVAGLPGAVRYAPRSRVSASGRDARARRARPPRLRPLADTGRAGGTRPARRTGCGPPGRSAAAANGRNTRVRRDCPPGFRPLARKGGREAPEPPRGPGTTLAERVPDASTVRSRRAGGMPERARPDAGCSARSRAGDGREARQPPAGPAAGLPSGLSNLPHRERAEDQRRRAAHPGVPPARAPTASSPGHRAPGPGHQRCRSTGAAVCRCAEVGSPYVCRERPPRLDRL